MENTNKQTAQKVLRGKVVSDKMEKTITVLVESTKQHPIYKKQVKFSKKFKAHDEMNASHIGDTVDIVECRHLSKDKYFRLLNIVEKAK